MRVSNPELPNERLDRELLELLNGLRVIIPGIQVLFAFLLTVPFQNRFADITSVQKSAYFVAVLCTAVATAFLIAVPTSHRLLFREFEKEWLLRRANAFSLIGTAFLAVAIVAALFMLTDWLYQREWALVVSIGSAILMGSLWFGVPMTRKARREHDKDPQPARTEAGTETRTETRTGS
jgi:hypothetical protein